MARKKVTESELRSMRAARQERVGGRFGGLKPEFKKSSGTATLESVMQPPTAPSAPPQAPTSAVPPKVGLPTSPFDKNAAALIAEAEKLSKDVAIADNEQAQKIAAKLKVIRELAKKTKGNQEALTANLDKVISPIEAELKKKASFRGFLQERAAEFRKTLPEKLASKIPLVGGLVGGYLKQRRESQEGLDKYARDLEMGKEGGRGRGFGGLGATPASDIPGIGTDISKSMQSTLGGIYEEIKKIRELVENKFAPESDASELSKRESELEGMAKGIPGDKLKPTGEKKSGLIGSLLDKLKTMMGGIGSSLMGMLSSISSTILAKAKTLVEPAWEAIKSAGGKMLEKAKELAKPAWEATKGVAGKAWDATKNLGGKAWEATKSMGGKAWEATKSIAKPAMESVKSMGGKAWEATKSIAKPAMESVKSIAKPAMESVKSVGGKALAKAGGWMSKAWSSVAGAASKLNPAKALGGAVKSGAPKILKAIAGIPGLGAMITAAMGAFDVMSIKNNPELKVDEKKEKIGVGLVKILGSVLGSVGGGMLGTLIPVPGIGTIIGTLGGEWVGSKVAEMLGEAIGGRKIYDMMASIPGIGSLIAVEEKEEEPKTLGAGGEEVGDDLKAPTGPQEINPAMMMFYDEEIAQAQRNFDRWNNDPRLNDSNKPGVMKKRNEALANLEKAKAQKAEYIKDIEDSQKQAAESKSVTGTVSAPATSNTTVGKMVGEYSAQKEALGDAQAAAAGGGGKVVNNSSVETRVNNTTNNFNDDIRIRNNDPTLKTMQMAAHSF